VIDRTIFSLFFSIILQHHKSLFIYSCIQIVYEFPILCLLSEPQILFMKYSTIFVFLCVWCKNIIASMYSKGFIDRTHTLFVDFYLLSKNRRATKNPHINFKVLYRERQINKNLLYGSFYIVIPRNEVNSQAHGLFVTLTSDFPHVVHLLLSFRHINYAIRCYKVIL
jgi:hypothetical protein